MDKGKLLKVQLLSGLNPHIMESSYGLIRILERGISSHHSGENLTSKEYSRFPMISSNGTRLIRTRPKLLSRVVVTRKP